MDHIAAVSPVKQPHHPQPQTLAWHETLELHELVASQSIALMKLKKTIGRIDCQTLKGIYATAVKGLESNLKELLPYYRRAPHTGHHGDARGHMDKERMERALYAGDLLAFAKSSVRAYAVAVTETATPELRNLLTRQLNQAVELHGTIFYYMYERSLYPAYNLEQLLSNDVQLAQAALAMKLS